MTAAVLWDIDGTFALTETLHFESLLHVSGRYGARLDGGLQRQMVGWSAQRVYDHLRAARGLDVDFATWANERYFFYRDHAATIRPRPGALDVWRRLERRGLAQALVSNSDRLLVDINIKALGLDRPRLVSVSRNDVREGKPDAEPYRRACYLLGVDAADCIAVEDTPSGAVAALAAGARVAIWPEDTTLDFPGAGRLIDDIDELLTLVTDR